MAWSEVWLAPSQAKTLSVCSRLYSVCAVYGMADCGESKGYSESKPEARTATSA